MSKRKQFNYEPFEQELEILLAQGVITDWRFQTAGQYSVNGQTMYLYPKSKKCYFAPTGEWGTYEVVANLLDLIKDF